MATPSANAPLTRIAESIGRAAENARALDLVASQDLRSLLNLAASETQRIQKWQRRNSKLASAKPAKKEKLKKTAKVEAPVAAQPKSRRKAASASINGAAH